MDRDFINGTTTDGIISFEKALSDYIEAMNSILNQIIGAHTKINCEWNDTQYKKIGIRLQEFENSMRNQLKKLKELYEYVLKKRKAFERALEEV